METGIELYYDKYTGHVTDTKPLVDKSSKGGILSDEMGLGKTVEVLACFLSNPKDPAMYEKKLQVNIMLYNIYIQQRLDNSYIV